MEHFMDVASSGPSEESILEQTYRLEAYLKGQGYVGSEVLNVLSPSTSQAQFVIDLLFQMAQQQSNDRGAREELRDQANKERVAANVAQKKLESQEEAIRKLQAKNQEYEGKLLAQKHSYEEKLSTLKRDLKSTQLRLNALLPGGSKEVTVRRGGSTSGNSGGGAAAGAVGPGGARRVVAPTYDRFHDDPSDMMQRLEADMSRLRLANDKLKRELAAAREQAAAAARREDQAAVSPREGTSFQSQSQSQSAGAGSRSPTSPDPEVARLQRRDREMELTLDHLRRQLDKAVEERSELHKTLHSLRQKNISLDQERRNFEDRFLRAQRAHAALQPGPSSTELQQQLEGLRAQVAGAQREAQEANARAVSLEGRLVEAEAAQQSNKRYVEVLKRSIQLSKGPDTLEAVQRVVEEVMAPAHEQLQQRTAELATARAELAEARRQAEAAAAGAASTLRSVDSAASASASCAGCGGAGGGLAAATAAGAVAPDSALPLSPAGLQPISPAARFDGFAPGPLPNSGSPPLLQPPPAHAFYNRAFAATMPSPHSERMLPSCPEQGPACLDAECSTEDLAAPGAGGASPSTSQPAFGGGRMRSSPHLQYGGMAASHGGAFGGGFGAAAGGFGQQHSATPNTGELAPFTSEAGGFAAGPSPAHWRRSLSAGPVRNLSTERQRRTWQVEHTAQAKRWPSPADILLHQARSGDGTISINDGASTPLQPRNGSHGA
ncbi:hypothetical protein CHLRE_10g427650v5 [Chlamydomonas reinhardtii]|uniref:Uncharacterized protein n=1 Tax=Chlamydomonas reinhardtii TaxID=3055 RepID=A0A2K3D9M3_CHLRE|nr:uncharacterized protein CHLRE_10g427650v5 [Chlamydomonas reinhardtii]PNW77227.1 hypothetical protein CHLRE_10g427650v5 [Chlamydomonas reinhardtii]